jgi:competence protein ComEC
LPFLVLISLAFICLVLSGLFYKVKKLLLSDIFILLIFLFLGFIWIRPYALVLPKQVLNQSLSVYAKVASEPKNSSTFTAYITGPNYLIYDGGKIYFPNSISVKDYSDKPISYLDYYLFKGKLRPSTYAKSDYTLYITKKDIPVLVKKSKGLSKLAYIFSQRIAAIFTDNFSKSTSTFILSIFLGKRQDLSQDIKDIFSGAGTSHILAISGLHTGLVAAIFLFILKVLRVRFRVRYILVSLIILGYGFLCGLKTPVVRASIMFICWSLSFLLLRKACLFNALSLAGLINLFFKPNDIFSISFQLSYIAVLSIGIGFRYFYPIKSPSTFGQKIKILFLSSLFVNIGLMPLVSFYWGKVYLLNIFSNMLVIPYLGLIISSLFVFLSLYLIFGLKVLLSASCSVLISVFLKLNHFFAAMPLSYLDYRFSYLGIFVYYGCIAVALSLLRLVYFKVGLKRNL